MVETIIPKGSADRIEGALQAMFRDTGAGEWPPAGAFEETWPEELRPFATLCDAASRKFVSKDPAKEGIASTRPTKAQGLDDLHEEEPDKEQSPLSVTEVLLLEIPSSILLGKRNSYSSRRASIARSSVASVPPAPMATLIRRSSSMMHRSSSILRIPIGHPPHAHHHHHHNTATPSRRSSMMAIAASWKFVKKDLGKKVIDPSRRSSAIAIAALSGGRRSSAISIGVDLDCDDDQGTQPENNLKAMQDFRRWMITEVEDNCPEEDKTLELLADMERAEKNGFLTCLAFLLFMYRWGMAPVVKEAQLETDIIFPPELWVPFVHLNEELGMACVGTVASTYLFNGIKDKEGIFSRFRFQFNDSRFKETHDTEENFMRLFWEQERVAAKMFKDMVNCIRALENGNQKLAEMEFASVRESAERVYNIFSYYLQDSRVSFKCWMRYVQGPCGWDIQGVNGLTGAHALPIPVIDAFLGLRGTSDTYTFVIKHRAHMTKSMRDLLEAFEGVKLDAVLNSGGYSDKIYEEYDMIVRRLRGYRISHKYRVLPYFNVDAKERIPMTAGGGQVTKDKYGTTIVQESDVKREFVELFRNRLNERLAETVSPVTPPPGGQPSWYAMMELQVLDLLVLMAAILAAAAGYFSLNNY
jgi:hypothetical protein